MARACESLFVKESLMHEAWQKSVSASESAACLAEGSTQPCMPSSPPNTRQTKLQLGNVRDALGRLQAARSDFDHSLILLKPSKKGSFNT